MATLPLIEIIKRQALATFSKVSSGLSSNFEDNLLRLRSLMNKVTSEDVSLDSNLLNVDPGNSANSSAPVTYIEILDDPSLTIGIFVLKRGARLPLHDHPLMYGILKVVHGTVNIQSYSIVTDEQKIKESNLSDLRSEIHPEDIELSNENLNRQITMLARKEHSVNLSSTDDSCLLSPVSGNLHEIHTVNGPAAFLDVLSPPYGTDIPGVGPRPCRYFKELESCEGGSNNALANDDSQNQPSELVKLLRIPSPPDYWSDSAPYLGP